MTCSHLSSSSQSGSLFPLFKWFISPSVLNWLAQCQFPCIDIHFSMKPWKISNKRNIWIGKQNIWLIWRNEMKRSSWIAGEQKWSIKWMMGAVGQRCRPSYPWDWWHTSADPDRSAGYVLKPWNYNLDDSALRMYFRKDNIWQKIFWMWGLRIL